MGCLRFFFFLATLSKVFWEGIIKPYEGLILKSGKVCCVEYLLIFRLISGYMLPWVTETFLARFPVSVKRCVGLRPTPKIPAAREKSTQGSYMCERLTPGLRRKDWILQALLLAVTSLWPHKVGSRGEIYSARWKLMLLSDQAKDVVKNCFEGGGSMSPFQPMVYIRDLK